MTVIKASEKFYCSQKFWWLTVDLEKIQTLSCCAATPSRLDLSWLKNNPGQIFNTSKLLNERSSMLSGKPVASCSATCWAPESRGLISRRLATKSQYVTHENIRATPRELHILVGSDCNLTCSYCCKQYSTAWARDIKNNGDYQLASNDDRYQLNNKDLILMKIGQKELINADFNQVILNELDLLCATQAPNKIIISGGEPFLYLGLQNLVHRISSLTPIQIWTGLGVDTQRFQKEIDKIADRGIEIVVSAENTEKLYEFNRYGNTWDRFIKNIEYLDKAKINYKFSATISNLTIFGIKEFIKFADGKPIIYGPCTNPEFLAVNMIDPETKDSLSLHDWPDNLSVILNGARESTVDINEKKNLKIYLNEFASRRNLSLEIFPRNFLDWVDDV